VFPSRFTRLSAARVRFGDRVDRLGVYLTRADPLADGVVESIEAMAPGVGWDLFGRMLRAEAAAGPGAPEPMRALLASVERVPVWLDWDAVDRGGRVLLRAGAAGGLVLAFKSLVMAYTSPAGNKPLVFSGRLTDKASRRLQETALFVRSTISAGGMRPHAPGWRSTLQVRLIHAQVRRMILATGRWDADAWGAPINQHDELGTSLLFSSVLLEGLRQLGLRVTAADAESYMHLWRWSGWLMGIDPDLLPATEGEGHRLAALMAATQNPPDDDSRALTRALLEAPLREARPGDISRARRTVRIGSALCRMFIGDGVADGLGVPRSRWAHPMRWLRPVVSGVDRLGRVAPAGAEATLRAGQRYWDRVVAVGLGGATSELALPTRFGA
jgi:hypothetical protein